jgi:hypothetical protein
LYRSILGLAAIAWLVAIAVGGYFLGRHDSDPRYNPVPTMGFAGADLVYVLRRVAAEGNVVLALDEVRPSGEVEDLRARWVDVDLGNSSLEQAVEAVRDRVGGFNYDFRYGLLYVRSTFPLEADTGVDRKELPGGSFEGDLRGLGRWIQQTRPATFMNIHLRRGHPAGPEVQFHLPPQSSVLDALLLYARESGVGWRMRRAGQLYPAPGGKTVVVSTEVYPWYPLSEPHNTAPLRTDGSTLQNIARVSVTTGTPICIVDMSLFYGAAGMLDLPVTPYPGSYSAIESLKALATLRAPGSDPPFRWEERDGLVVVYSEVIDRLPRGAEILEERLGGGRFQGSLAELGRWLTQQLRRTSGRRLAAGEIVPGAPTATLLVEEGTTVGEVLESFARATKRGWYLATFDRATPKSQLLESWRGAYLSDLAEWGEEATPY